VLLACAAAALLAPGGPAAHAQPVRIDVLHIGSSGSLEPTGNEAKEEGALKTLRDFIKDETGFNNDIVRQKDWREVADKLAKKQLHLGVYQGYEFAWAQEKYPGLKPLAVAVNIYRYPTVHVVTRKNDPATDFAGLKGHSLAIPAGSGRYVNLFVDRQGQGKADTFFSKVTAPDNAETALDDLVDGKVQAVAADRAALEAYKRRKPGRFNQLKEVAKSQPFPPAVVAYQEGVLDEATLRKFRDGLLRASRTDRGETLLTQFKLTGFEAVPQDLNRVLAQTREAYPPPAAAGGE
jgi:ABC-type phosphate/phosphonate transport system substrate-binding protein